MSFRIENGDHIAKEVRRIARAQVEGAIQDLRRLDHEDPESVHDSGSAARRCALFSASCDRRSAISTPSRTHFRDAARSLSPLRDAHSALVAYDLLLDHYRGEVRRAPLAAVRRHLVQVEERTKHDTDDLEDRYAQVRDEMEAARRRIDDWPITDLGLETWRAGFERTYRRARRAMSAAYDAPTPEHFPEWRKAAKYHGYHGHGRSGCDSSPRSRGGSRRGTHGTGARGTSSSAVTPPWTCANRRRERWRAA